MELPQGIKLTPMLEQYLHWKKLYPDCLLFFRMGDFYEMFFDDAKTASQVLDIVLTSRSKDTENPIPMAGVPYHAVDSYLGRLVEAGHKIAVCEQITEPDGKTLVERSVTKIITPGTWFPENSDSSGKIAACLFDGNDVSAALLSSADGTLRAGTFKKDNASWIISSFHPDEIIIKKGQADLVLALLPHLQNVGITERDKSEFDTRTSSEWLCRRWKIATLNSMGFDDRDTAAAAAHAALRYLEETQFSKATHVNCVTPILPEENLILDLSTQTNLELADSSDTSLYFVLNRCKTPMGKRLLKEWILSPLRDIEMISKRQDSVSCLIDDRKAALRLASLMSECKDMAKSIGRITLGMGSPSDLLVIKQTLSVLPEIQKTMNEFSALCHWSYKGDLSGLSSLLSAAVSDTVPRFLKDGGVIKDGYDKELDSWRGKAQNASSWLSDFEETQRTATGIKTLKAGVNKVFGYYIEVPKGGLDKVPLSYVRKQTLVNAERFITEELKEFEKDMFSAEDEIQALEEKIYSFLVAETLASSREIQSAASSIAITDVLLALSETAYERNYTRPVIDMGTDFVVKGARHPVIEITLGKNPFTPNDFSFSSNFGQRIAIITGPNMAGKSTYLRTAALIAIMAHMGSYVPAESAHIGLIDRVFTRIGARDELARGQSTFMVEMVETANILRHATDRSLVILDEVGRGTSTYDGLSIAWSVLEFLHSAENKRARVLFATHYHELTKLPKTLPGVVNLSMAVEETQNGIIFLHKVVSCPSDRSYGVEVARLAGVPISVIKRSKELLEQFENDCTAKNSAYLESRGEKDKEHTQTLLFDLRQDAVLEELAMCSPDAMTPMEALALVYRLREESRKALDIK